MKRKVLSILMALTLVISCCSVAFATPADEGIVPYETDSATYIVDRTSATTAETSVYVFFSQTVDRYSVVVYLEKLSNGEWVIASEHPNKVIFNNGIQASHFHFAKTYTGLKRGTTYRLSVTSIDYIGSAKHTFTFETRSF